MAKAHLSPEELFAGLDDELVELMERLNFDDDDSVWAWLRHHYPDTMARIDRAGERREFMSAVRDLWEIERGC